MRNIFRLSLALFIMLMNGRCLKDKNCKDKSVESEQAAIVSYAASSGITATPHSSGLYYEVITPGSGATPSLSSTVSVKYTGKLLNGTVFDSQTVTPLSFMLGQVIRGWQVGIPLIQKGGFIKLIVPSSLAYGCNGYGIIPGNSVLYFEVELVDVR